MKKVFVFISFMLTALTASLVLSGCEAVQDTVSVEYSTEFFAMDTIMTMTAYGENAEIAVNEAEYEINRLDTLLSVGNSNSEVAVINTNNGGEMSSDTAVIVRKSLEIYNLTDGAFDITVYPLMKEWGFYSGEYYVPTTNELNDLLKMVGCENIILLENELTFEVSGMSIDLGGIAKGFTSNRVAEILSDYGIESAIISLGGNVHALGCKPDGSLWKVAIQDPNDESSYIGIVEVSDKAIVTSGGYQRYFEENGIRYHHILDPETGFPANSGLLSVSIVCDDGMLADGLSTALFVMGTDDAIEFWRSNAETFDAILITENGDIIVTQGLENVFTSDLDFEVISR